MATPPPEVQQLANRYRLGLPRLPRSGRTGEMLGRGTGSSTEFQEYREYLPGDDIRHLDWSAYARTDQLMVRLYREEISPQLEILLDLSASMTTDPSKWRLALDITWLLSTLAGSLGAVPRIFLLHNRRPCEVVGLEGLDRLTESSFTASLPMTDLLAEGGVPLRSRAVRVAIGDFLFPHDSEGLVRSASREASLFWAVQILTEFEADPSPLGGRRLVDVETGAETDLRIDRELIAEYHGRLTRLQTGLKDACRHVSGRFAVTIAERGLSETATELSRVGLLEPI